jgi:hypothetical protein
MERAWEDNTYRLEREMFIVEVRVLGDVGGPRVEAMKRDGMVGVGRPLSEAILREAGFGLISNASLLFR